jgi:hypothetical protein
MHILGSAKCVAVDKRIRIATNAARGSIHARWNARFAPSPTTARASSRKAAALARERAELQWRHNREENDATHLADANSKVTGERCPYCAAARY